MHELSLAMNIVDICYDNIKEQKIDKVRSIELEIGELSGVVIEAMEMALEQSTKGTVFEEAEFNINKISGYGKCKVCGNEQEMHDFFAACNKCGSFEVDIIKGDELKVSSIIVD